MSEQLAACPFCGAAQAIDRDDLNGVWIEKNDHSAPEYHVHCWSCGAQSNEFQGRDEAVTAWNTRVTAPTRDGAVGRLRAALEKIAGIQRSTYAAARIARAALATQAEKG